MNEKKAFEVREQLANEFWKTWDNNLKRNDFVCDKCSIAQHPHELCFLCIFAFAVEELRKDIQELKSK